MGYYYRAEFHELWIAGPGMALGYQEVPAWELGDLGVESMFELNNSGHISSPTVVLPDLSPHIVLHFLGGNNWRMKLIGPRTQAVFFDRRRRKRTFIFRFHPLAINQLISLPITELIDRSYDLADLLGKGCKERIREQFAERGSAGVFEAVLQLLQNTRNHEMHTFTNVGAFLQLMKLGHDRQTVRQSARELGISERYLHKTVKKELGMSPKTALKINRFTQSLKTRQKNPHLPWSQLAQSSGYFDQSHMIDEYQQFLNTSPTRLFP